MWCTCIERGVSLYLSQVLAHCGVPVLSGGRPVSLTEVLAQCTCVERGVSLYLSQRCWLSVPVLSGG